MSTENEKKSSNESVEVQLNPDWESVEPKLREALQGLAANSAAANDGLGFNRFDQETGRRLAFQESWTGRDRYTAALLAKRYRRQLPIDTRREIFGNSDLDAIARATLPTLADLSAAGIGEEIRAEDEFAKGPSEELFVYKDGCYRAKGEAYVKRRVKSFLRSRDAADEWSPKLANEVVEYLRVDARDLLRRPPIGVVNVLNGLLDVETRMLTDHSPDFRSSVQIPVAFDPEAECPAWRAFIRQVFPTGKAQDLAYEIIGDLMIPDRSIQKALLLVGEGGNGKSVYLAGLRAFVGPENVSAVSLQDLSTNRFAMAALRGKLANIYPDLPARHLKDSAHFKAIVGGDELSAEQKYRSSFSFKPFVRLVFSSNHLPYSSDASEAFFDRFIIIPFERSFRGRRREVSREELDGRLAAPHELSGLLNLALDALDRLRARRRFTEVTATRRAMAEYREIADPLQTWLSRSVIAAPGSDVPVKEVRDAYNREAVRAGRSPLSDSQFGKRFGAIRPEIVKAKRGTRKCRVWCYLDVELESEPRR